MWRMNEREKRGEDGEGEAFKALRYCALDPNRTRDH
jgi:hypothetical protein